MIRVVLPPHLRNLAKTGREVSLEVEGTATIGAALDELEAQYPMLKGTIRNQHDGERRAMIRFFANGEDWSHNAMDQPLPPEVAEGNEPLMIVGAIAGG